MHTTLITYHKLILLSVYFMNVPYISLLLFQAESKGMENIF